MSETTQSKIQFKVTGRIDGKYKVSYHHVDGEAPVRGLSKRLTDPELASLRTNEKYEELTTNQFFTGTEPPQQKSVDIVMGALLTLQSDLGLLRRENSEFRERIDFLEKELGVKTKKTG